MMVYRNDVTIGLQQALLNHVWRSIAVVLFVWVLAAVLRNHRAWVRYARWTELTLKRQLALAATAAFVVSLPVTAGMMDAQHVHAQSKQQPYLPGASDDAQAFEVAVVRPSHLTPGCFSMLPQGSSHFSITCMSLRGLIAIAYRLNESHVDGPSKELDRLYDINATTGDKPVERADVAPLLRTLLAERFHLKVHTTERPVSGFELVIAKGGPKLKKTAATNINEAQGVRAGQGSPNFITRGMIQGTAANMQTVAGLLGIPAGKPVVDRTGLQGFYDIRCTLLRRTIKVPTCRTSSQLLKSSWD